MSSGRLKKVGANLKKNKALLIKYSVVIVILTVGVWVVLNELGKANQNSEIIIPDVPGGSEGDMLNHKKTSLSDEAKKVFMAKEQDDAIAASKKGGSFITTLELGSDIKDKNISKKDNGANTISAIINKKKATFIQPKAKNQPSVGYRRVDDKPYKEPYKEKMKQAQTELKSLMSFLKKKSSAHIGFESFVVDTNTPEADANIKTVSGLSKDVINDKTIQKAQKTIINAGDVLHARFVFSLNTDFKTPVLAQIIDTSKGSMIDKAIITGTMQHNNKFDKMVIKFSSIEIKNKTANQNKKYAFSAIVVDPNSDLAAVADNVDHHYFDRFVLPVLLEGVSTAADVFTKQRIKRTKSDLSSDSTLYDEQYIGGDKQVVAGLIKGGVSSLKDIFVKDTTRGITVTKDKRYVIKIIALTSLVISR